MNIIKQAHRVEVKDYQLVFTFKNEEGSGFSFDCNKAGVVAQNMNPAAQENYNKCLDGTYAVECIGVRDMSYSYRVPATGKCACGRTIELESFTNECSCGALYNEGGQSLAPRKLWNQ